ncbi:MAG TPA: hypothetical protein VKA19_06315 [Alphaproteobacteria bacterium]|nr:hypothetical protein [Alphaproteobacteria bacterium]
MAEVIHLEPTKNDTVEILRDALARAERGEIACLLMTEVSDSGSVFYSRSGKVADGEGMLKLIGSVEHHKNHLIERLNQFLQENPAADGEGE